MKLLNLAEVILNVFKKRNCGHVQEEVENNLGTFGKEAVPYGDPVGGVGGSGGTARLSSIVPLQLPGQCKHGYAAVICLGLPHAALRCCSNA